MKQKLVVGIMVVSVLVLSRIAAAESLDFNKTKWEVSGQVGAAIQTADDSETGGYLLGRLTYDIVPNIAIGATTGWNGYEVHVDGDNWGDATSIPLLATVIFKMPIEATENRVVPYLIGGLGVTFWSLDESSLLNNNSVKVDNETSFAAQIGAGMDYFISDRIGVFAELSYVFTEIDTSINAPGLSGTLSGDTDAIYIGAGAKARF